MRVFTGVSRRSEIGFLSLFEHYNGDTMRVGEYYKKPAVPIWESSPYLFPPRPAPPCAHTNTPVCAHTHHPTTTRTYLLSRALYLLCSRLACAIRSMGHSINRPRAVVCSESHYSILASADTSFREPTADPTVHELAHACLP